MISNFLQKPLGIVTVLTAAVGGPYAAFETDLGTSLRQSLVNASSIATTNSSESQLSTPEQLDPYALLGSKSNSTPQSNLTPQSNFIPNGYVSGANAAVTESGWRSDSSTPAGQLVSTVYGPTTVYPVGPNTPFPNAGAFQQGIYPQASQPFRQEIPQAYASGYLGNPIALPNPAVENRAGTSQVIPGGTDQLWDYTLGTPSLPQLQQQPQTAVGGGVVNDLREVLRFDIVPGWLPQRFARVTTVTSNVQMDGLRVPLITGTQPKDIAGSLTYYFDASQALKRINLHGLTGDPTQLITLMVQFYQLKPEQSLGGQLFTSRWNNRVTSVMQIAPAPIIYAGADHSKYIIFLELNQPSSHYAISEEASEILRTLQATQRW